MKSHNNGGSTSIHQADQVHYHGSVDPKILALMEENARLRQILGSDGKGLVAVEQMKSHLNTYSVIFYVLGTLLVGIMFGVVGAITSPKVTALEEAKNNAGIILLAVIVAAFISFASGKGASEKANNPFDKEKTDGDLPK